VTGRTGAECQWEPFARLQLGWVMSARGANRETSVRRRYLLLP